MRRFIQIHFLSLLFVTASCSRFVEPELDHSSQLAIPDDAEKGIPALEFNRGILDDFSGEIYSWWMPNDQIHAARKADTLKVTFKNVGPLYTPFGRQITSLDFTGSTAVRVRMRAEGKTSPTVRLDLKDNLGKITNAVASSVKVPINQGYNDYFFNFNDKWKQSYPDVQSVDPTLVSEIMFFINPGMTGWSGILYFDEIVVIQAESIPKKEGSAGGMVDTFDEEPSSWWTGSSKIALEKVKEKDIVMITSEGAGSNYETFGRTFEQADFTKSPILRIKARAENGSGQENPTIRLAIKDSEGFVANEFNITERVGSGNEFRNYFFNFKNKFSQSYPDAHPVNPKEIVELIVFINSGGPPYNGIIYFDEIEIISEKKYDELKNN